MLSTVLRAFRKTRGAVSVALLAVCGCCLAFPPPVAARQRDENIVSKHVRLLIPFERQWLGREVISELERCWEFVQGATGGRLPGRVLVVIEWDDAASTVDPERSIVTIGMNSPAAAADMKGFLLHSTARDLSRLALIGLSEGRASQEENRFLLEGMSEMLARDFSGSVRRLGAAWAICYYLDRMTPLALKQISGRPEFSGDAHDLRTAAPGITFLTSCRDLYGRERLLKLFESLAKKSLDDSLTAAFKTSPKNLEAAWLKRLRAYRPADITIAGEEEAPVLERVAFVPDSGKAGGSLEVRVFTRDGANDLMNGGIFVIDDTTGTVVQGKEGRSGDGRYTQVALAIEPAREAGRYRLQLIAVDEGGNVRNWESFYSVAR